MLIVDDDLGVARALARVLSDTCAVETALSLEEGRAALVRDRPIGLIVDFALPDGTGLELVAMARNLDATLPVLLITAHLSPRLAAHAYGADIDFLPKPIESATAQLFARRCVVRGATTRETLRLVGLEWATRFNLTLAEREILVAAAAGASPSDITDARDITDATYKRHVTNLLGKVGATSLHRAALTLLAEVLGRR